MVGSQAEAAHGCELGGVQGVDAEVWCTVPTEGPEPCLVGCAHASGWWVCVSRVGGGDGWQLCGVDGIKELRLVDMEGLVGGSWVKAQAGHTLPHTGSPAGTGVPG